VVCVYACVFLCVYVMCVHMHVLTSSSSGLSYVVVMFLCTALCVKVHAFVDIYILGSLPQSCITGVKGLNRLDSQLYAS
jgi:hypothetical protein